jgi:K+-transporting ATPase ATPase C chain
MMRSLRPLFVITAALFVLCCVVYPAVVTAGAQVLFKDKANGSLVEKKGKVVGSALIGQSIADWGAHPEYFWGRPSAATNDATTGITYSSGSNYGPTNPALADEVKARIEILRATGVTGPIPADLVTKSASGLDPHLSPRAIEIQIPRVAAARNVSVDTIKHLVAASTEESTFGLLGEPRVNVLILDLALDDKAPYTPPPAPAPSTSASAP